MATLYQLRVSCVDRNQESDVRARIGREPQMRNIYVIDAAPVVELVWWLEDDRVGVDRDEAAVADLGVTILRKERSSVGRVQQTRTRA